MSEILSLDRVSAGYGQTVVLHDLSLSVGRGEFVTILGRNGAGKTTLFATIAGLSTLHSGTISVAGAAIGRLPTWRRSRLGVALVPQEREIFSSLSVEENLLVSARGAGWSIDRVYSVFSALSERRRHSGNELSGGEQQMLAIGRALMGEPQLLLLDEPFEGLSPVMMETMAQAINRLRTETAITILLVEQRVKMALHLAPRSIVLVNGAIAYDGASQDLANDRARLAQLIGVSG